jgi:hypothetical protein
MEYFRFRIADFKLVQNKAVHKQVIAEVQKCNQSSYRTRRCRDPVSSSWLFSLDSPPEADCAPSGMTGSVLEFTI